MSKDVSQSPKPIFNNIIIYQLKSLSLVGNAVGTVNFNCCFFTFNFPIREIPTETPSTQYILLQMLHLSFNVSY